MNFLLFLNTIIAANSDDSPGTLYPDCWGVLNSLDYNLIQDTTGQSPNLGPVSGNERGRLRPGMDDPRCDIGAYEANAGIPTYLPLIVKNEG